MMAGSIAYDFIIRDEGSKTLRNVRGESEKTHKALQVLGTATTRSFGFMKASIGAVVGTLGIGMATALKKGFERSESIEDAKGKLIGLGHSAKDVQMIMDEALTSVKGTSFGLDTAATVAASAVAAGVRPGRDLQGVLNDVADAASIAGADLGDMGLIFDKVAAKNKLQAQDINALTARGIPILSFLAKQYGVTQAKAAEMVSKGKINFREFDQAMRTNLAGAAKQSGTGVSGSFANMGAAVSRFGQSLLSGIFPQFEGFFGGITTLLDNAGEKVKPWSDKFGRGLHDAVRLAGRGFQIAKTYWDAFRKGLDGWRSEGAGGIAGKVENFGFIVQDTFKKAKGYIHDFTTVADGYLKDFQRGWGGNQAFGSNISVTFQNLGLAAKTAFDNIVAGVKGIDLSGFGTAVDNMVTGVDWKGIQNRIANYLGGIDFNAIADRWSKAAVGWVQPLIDGITTGVHTGHWNKLGEAIADRIANVLSNLAQGAAKLTAAFVNLMGKVDWVGIGIAIGKQVPAMLIGLAAGILNFDLGGLLNGLKKHWFDVLIGVLSIAFAPERLAVKIAGILAKVPFVGRLLAWGFTALRGFSRGIIKRIGDVLGFLGKAFLDGFRRVFPGIGSRFATWLEILPTRIGVMRINAQEKIKAMVKGLGTSIKNHIGNVTSAIGELIGRMLRAFFNANKWLTRRGVEFVRGLKNGIVDAVRGTAGWVRTYVIDPYTTPFRRAVHWLVGAGHSLISGLKSGAVNGMARIGTWIADHIRDPITSKFSRIANWLVGSGHALISGLKQGAIDGLGNAERWFSSIGHRIISGVKKFFGIRSPSRVFAGLGGHLMSGLERGMLNSNPVAITKRVFGSMPNALKSMFNKGLLNNVTHWSGSAMKVLGDLFTNVIGGTHVSGNAAKNQRIAAMMLSQFGWGGNDMRSLSALWMGESGWNQYALNKSSGAYGIPQALPASKMSSAGGDWRSNPATQILWGLRYIKSRYGSPGNALMQWQSRHPHWYANGGTITEPVIGMGLRSGSAYGFGEKGPETVIPGTGHSGGTIIINVNGITDPRQAAKAVARELTQLSRNGYKLGFVNG